ncbi:unnamed protein product, partial [marine sediment metagenome]
KMKEIRCQNPKCNHCLSKGIEVGAGMYYISPSKPLRLYREVIKCPKCDKLNEVIIEMGVRAKVRIIEDDRKVGIDTYIIKKD